MRNRLEITILLLVLSQTMGCACLVRPKTSELSLHQKFCPPSVMLPQDAVPVVAAQPNSLTPFESRQNLVAENSSAPRPLPPVLSPAEARRQRDLRFAQAQRQAEEQVFQKAAAALQANSTLTEGPSHANDREQSGLAASGTPCPAPQSIQPPGTIASKQSNYLSATPRSTPSPILFVTITALVLSGVTWPLAVRQRRNYLRASNSAVCQMSTDIELVARSTISQDPNWTKSLWSNAQVSHWSWRTPAQAGCDSESFCFVLWDADAYKPLSEHLELPSPPPPDESRPAKSTFALPALIRLQSPNACKRIDYQLDAESLKGMMPPTCGLIQRSRNDALSISIGDLMPDVSFCRELAQQPVDLVSARLLGGTPAQVAGRYLVTVAGRALVRHAGITPARASYLGFVVLFGNDSMEGSDRQILGIQSYEVDQDQSLVARVVRVA